MARQVAAGITGRSPLAVSAGFLGAFVVASLAVQLVRSYAPGDAVVAPASVRIEPVLAHQAALWQTLGQP
jgi:hypothetical protein